MFQRLSCIALRTVRYDDRRSIVTAWSRELGRVSLMMPDGASREARRRRALLMPLGLFEGEADVRPGREMLSLRDVRPIYVAARLAAEPVKAMVAMFAAEVLERVLRQAAPDELLTDFIVESVVCLDRMADATQVANFPPVFLYRLGHFLGIQPDTAMPGDYFDMEAGRVRTSPSLQGENLGPAQTRLLRVLARTGYAGAAHLHLPADVRREMLDVIMRYYGLHHSPLHDVRSLEVLRDVLR